MSARADDPSLPSSRAEAEALVAALVARAPLLAERSYGEILRTLGRVGSRFLDPDDPLRREAVERIPEEAGFSGPVVEEILRGMAREWTAERLRSLVLADFPDPEVLDRFRPGPEGMRVRVVAGPFAFHVGSGNVPGVGATSLIRSLLVKCPVLLKPGRGDVALSRLFRTGLAEEDEELAGAAAVVYWPRGEGGELEAAAMAWAERVVAYGGPDAIAHLRTRLPAGTRLVRYPHRVSVGFVAREEIGSPDRAGRVARDAARAVAAFDQRGCVSPQIIWVEEGGPTPPVEWAASLARELEALESPLPAGPLDPSAASHLHQVRETARLREAAGSGDRIWAAPLPGGGETEGGGEGGGGAGWSVHFEPEERDLLPCEGRMVRVRGIADLSEARAVLEPFRAILQSVALAAPEARQKEIVEELARTGATRITTFRDQPWPPAWWRHDGEGPLLALVRWVGFEA